MHEFWLVVSLDSRWRHWFGLNKNFFLFSVSVVDKGAAILTARIKISAFPEGERSTTSNLRTKQDLPVMWRLIWIPWVTRDKGN